jgi:hypothetical protein
VHLSYEKDIIFCHGGHGNWTLYLRMALIISSPNIIFLLFFSVGLNIYVDHPIYMKTMVDTSTKRSFWKIMIFWQGGLIYARLLILMALVMLVRLFGFAKKYPKVAV